MHREDCDALRAELEARRDEIATLRGVVAALRVHPPALARASANLRLGLRAIVVIVLAAVTALLLAKGWIAALLCR